MTATEDTSLHKGYVRSLVPQLWIRHFSRSLLLDPYTAVGAFSMTLGSWILFSWHLRLKFSRKYNIRSALPRAITTDTVPSLTNDVPTGHVLRHYNEVTFSCKKLVWAGVIA